MVSLIVGLLLASIINLSNQNCHCILILVLYHIIFFLPIIICWHRNLYYFAIFMGYYADYYN